MVERESESLRDGEQAARERWQAQQEMEQGLIAQERSLEHFPDSSLAEPDDVREYDGDWVEGPGGTGTTGDDAGAADTSVSYENLEPHTFEGDGRHPLDEQGGNHPIEDLEPPLDPGT